ncbi:hypothetical protein PSCICL_16030 [Pseudomonas cichorii]|nr:hypothetical protein PSCICF_21980 [Pseudomonas cichorii]GFM60260.1 hypothetical protein PSCICG_14200 [Pseudomonas cichorii]GFM70611.1 hypothetical protein PSCICL_16030 [Pseudomonas cichorii]
MAKLKASILGFMIVLEWVWYGRDSRESEEIVPFAGFAAAPVFTLPADQSLRLDFLAIRIDAAD